MEDRVRARWQARMRDARCHAAGCPLGEREVPLGNPRATYALLELQGPEGRPVSARVVRPVGEGPFPVLLMFHDAGRPIRGWHHMTRFVALGLAVVALENRSGVEAVPVPEPLAVGDGLGVAVRVPTCEEPDPTGRVLPPEAMRAVEGTLRDALLVAAALPRVPGLDDSRVVTWGEGLGGGLALAVARLAGARAACALNPLPSALDERSASVDMAIVSADLSCPVLMGTGMLDLQASVAAQDVLAAGLRDVRRLRYPRYAHERINAFEDEMLAFLVAELGLLAPQA